MIKRFCNRHPNEALSLVIVLFFGLLIGTLAVYQSHEKELNRSVKNGVVTNKSYTVSEFGAVVYSVTITGTDANGDKRTLYMRVDKDDYHNAVVGRRW
jgi:uncharacterized protein YxeA